LATPKCTTAGLFFWSVVDLSYFLEEISGVFFLIDWNTHKYNIQAK